MFNGIGPNSSPPWVLITRSATVLVAACVMIGAEPAGARSYNYPVEEWVESSAAHYNSPRFAEAERVAIAAYGPFRVLNQRRAALVGATGSRTPSQFAAMLRSYPALATLEFIECPGTYDDLANLQLGRMIRAAGLTAEAFAGSSVRSGAVELFLAGTTRSIADDAEFAVHAWLDDSGRGALDYAPYAAENAKYLVYYREMGMSQGEATRFYAMTNSVPFEHPRWMTGEEMRVWMGRTTMRLQNQPHRHTSSRSIARRKLQPSITGYKSYSPPLTGCLKLNLFSQPLRHPQCEKSRPVYERKWLCQSNVAPRAEPC